MEREREMERENVEYSNLDISLGPRGDGHFDIKVGLSKVSGMRTMQY